MINEQFQVAIVDDDQKTAFAIFKNFSYCQLQNGNSEAWWKSSPLKIEEKEFESKEAFEIFVHAKGQELLPTSVVLRNWQDGNYRCGNYSNVERVFLNPSMVLQFPVETISYEQYGEENWHEERKQIYHISENGKNFVCTATIFDSKGGRGCQETGEQRWEIQEVEIFPNPAQNGKVIEL